MDEQRGCMCVGRKGCEGKHERGEEGRRRHEVVVRERKGGGGEGGMNGIVPNNILSIPSVTMQRQYCAQRTSFVGEQMATRVTFLFFYFCLLVRFRSGGFFSSQK